MSIKSLKRLTLGGQASRREDILIALQALGCMHLIPLSEDNAKVNRAIAMQQPTEASEALAWLSRLERRRRPVKDKSLIDVDELVAEILENKQRIRQQQDKRDLLKQRLQLLRPWGEFDLPELASIQGLRFWFYVLPLKKSAALSSLEVPWQEIYRDQKNAYIIVVSENEPDSGILPVERSRVGQDSLSKVEEHIEIAEQHLEDLYAEREALTRWIYPLSQSLAASQDHAELLLASSGVQDEGEFFLVQGWMPADAEEAILELSEAFGTAVLLEEPQADDQPPTLLENSDLTGGGAEAMGFFQTPNYRAWDPGNLVFYSFSLFFAMIMNDAMYSAIFGVIVLLFRDKFEQSIEGQRLKNLGLFMSGLGVAWGILAGSYFGVTPSEGSLLGSLNIIDMNDYSAMMKLSVFIGVMHLIIANVMTAYINRTQTRALAPLGWAALMFGGMVYWFAETGTVWQGLGKFVGVVCAIGGAGLVCVFSSNRPIDTPKGLALRILDGAKAIYNITGAFGDILSYMRLFALGLSGASLAMTFNSLAGQAIEAKPVSGVLFAGLILLLGHVLNFALCIMSGVVHGMRLNVIEFVNWGLSDEGYPFKAFRKKED
ncbi:V-type ATP synthase subunit I [Vibrio astriarenae]|uniref:V-type ATP synthase subunit I n=1 Tax=Vibrio astriarenae TaxID=1481923 RepID=A0A7Z2T794_9VIBR|nr:V-type ATP synthase subunit I [Vibrio astriarenae]QIA65577.1 V-type ATP synthase subunit I [Vibrio astriarenae]